MKDYFALKELCVVESSVVSFRFLSQNFDVVLRAQRHSAVATDASKSNLQSSDDSLQTIAIARDGLIVGYRALQIARFQFRAAKFIPE